MKRGIPVVIGTTTKIKDSIAYQLSRVFYENIANQHNIETSWQLAQAKIIGDYPNLSQFRGVSFGKEEEIAKNNLQSPWFIKFNPEKKGKEWKLKPIIESPKSLFLNRIPQRQLNDIVGRRKTLQNIYDKLHSHKSLLLMNGMGGIGKTTLAEVYVSEYKKEYNYLLWLRTAGNIKEAFLRDGFLLQKLQIKEAIEQAIKEQNLAKAWDIILYALHQQKGKGLFIVDNSEENDFEILTQIQESCPQLHILITSRSENLNFEQIYIDRLSLPKSIELFYHYYDPKGILLHNDDLVAEIVSIAGRHTLVIEILAKIVAIRPTHDFTQLIVELKQKGFDIARAIKVQHKYDEEKKHLFDILLTAFDIAGLISDDIIKKLLTHFAILPTQNIPFDILQALLPIPNETADEYAIALNTLSQNSWLQKTEGTTVSYYCHPVIRQVLFEKLQPNAEDCDEMIQFLIDDIKNIYYINPLDTVKWLPYTNSILTYLINEIESIATLINITSLIYQTIGNLPKSLEYGLSALVIFKKIYPIEHSYIAVLYDNISITYRRMGYLEKSLEYGLLALSIFKKILPLKHPDIATSYDNIGVVYSEMNNLEESLKYKLKALAIRENIFFITHPDLVASYSNISITYNKIGNLKKSLEYGLKALSIGEKIFSNKDNSLAIMYNNIGLIYGNIGNLEKSLEYGLKALNIQEKILSNKHYSLATSYNNISITYSKIKNWEKALYFQQKALNINISVLPFGHYNTKIMVNTMSEILISTIKAKGEEWAMPYIQWFIENCRDYLENE